MTLRCGIVGLPNVGKSTLFNALTQSQKAEAANYPFCTIEPNAAIVSLADERLKKLADIAGSQKIIPSWIEFVDIAGLVQGASKGEGLGNKFLSHIREVDAIVHVVRCFQDKDIHHVRGKVDPLDDIEIIQTELVLADLESAQKRLPSLQKKAKTDKEAKLLLEMLEQVYPLLEQGIMARKIITPENQDQFKLLQLLTTKPTLYVCNVNEDSAAFGNELTQKVREFAVVSKSDAIVISAQIESDIAQISSEDEKLQLLNMLGLSCSGINRIIEGCYGILDLACYFTIGPKEAHSWTFRKGMSAPAAAGIIHSDFERGFICAETISYQDYIEYGSESRVKEAGKLRLEGKEYKVRDADVINFRFNV